MVGLPIFLLWEPGSHGVTYKQPKRYDGSDHGEETVDRGEEGEPAKAEKGVGGVNKKNYY